MSRLRAGHAAFARDMLQLAGVKNEGEDERLKARRTTKAWCRFRTLWNLKMETRYVEAQRIAESPEKVPVRSDLEVLHDSSAFKGQRITFAMPWQVSGAARSSDPTLPFRGSDG